MYGLVQVAAPTAEPVLIQDLREWIRDEFNDQQVNLLQSLIMAARITLENAIERSFMPQTWQRWQDSFLPTWYWRPDNMAYFPRQWEQAPWMPRAFAIGLPRGPLNLAAGPVLINYVDQNGNPQTLTQDTDFTVDETQIMPVVVPAYGKQWPITRMMPKSVTITYPTGFNVDGSPPVPVPEPLKNAIKMLAANYYEQPEGIPAVPSPGDTAPPLPMAVRALISGFRIPDFADYSVP